MATASRRLASTSRANVSLTYLMDNPGSAEARTITQIRADVLVVGMRVIAGRFKGRRLKNPSWEGLRPTSDKLRETLFNILAPRVAGARVVDGFAGTGAVGIEALSRGAAHVTFIEKDRRALALIQENLSTCGVESGFAIVRGDTGAVLRSLPAETTFEIIVLDPAYDAADIEQTLDAAA